MKKFLIPALALAAASVAVPAMAQSYGPRHHDDRGGRYEQDRGGRWDNDRGGRWDNDRGGGWQRGCKGRERLPGHQQQSGNWWRKDGRVTMLTATQAAQALGVSKRHYPVGNPDRLQLSRNP